MVSIPEFEQYMQAAGIFWDSALIKIGSGAPGCIGPAWGVFSKAEIPEGTLLARIPKTIILSSKNTCIADVLEAERLGGGLGLTIALMHEISIKQRSQWYGYLCSLAAREYLPCFWSEEELQLLSGTESIDLQNSQREDLDEDFLENVAPLADKYPKTFKRGALTLEAFKAAASLVSSRAFGVDDYHGMSMVPLADVFNHKASVVELSEKYALEPACLEEDSESDGDVEVDDSAHVSIQNAVEQEGECTDSEGEHGAQPESSSEQSDPGGSEGDGVGVDGKPASTPRSHLLHLSPEERRALRLEMCIVGAEHEGGSALEILAASPIRKGTEVHNTYGEHGNAELLCKYGFTLQRNPFDYVRLRKADVMDAVTAVLGSRAARRRARFLTTHSDLLEEHAEPFELLPGAVLNPPLLVAAYVLLAPEADFSGWDSLDEPLRILQKACAAAEDHAAVNGPAKADDEQPGAEWRGTEGNESQHDQDLGALKLTDCLSSKLLSEEAGKVFAAVLRQRLSRYHYKSLQENLQHLQNLQSQPERSESTRAKICALSLVVSEWQIVDEALALLQPNGGSDSQNHKRKRGQS